MVDPYFSTLPRSFPQLITDTPERIAELVTALMDPARTDVPHGSSFAITADGPPGTLNLWLSDASLNYLTERLTRN